MYAKNIIIPMSSKTVVFDKRTEKNIKVTSIMTSDKRKSWFCPSIQKLADN